MPQTDDLRWFPFDGMPYQPRMALHPLAPEEWLYPDRHATAELKLRSELLASRRDDILLYSPESECGAIELNHLVKDHLLNCHPSHAEGTDANLRIVPTGRQIPAARTGIAALEQLAHLVQEDFCILSADKQPVLIAGLICFPSHWVPASKFGKTSDAIHAPVPGFAQKLSGATNAMLSRLLPDRSFWRINWTIHDSDTLHCPHPRQPRSDLHVGNVLLSTWLRLERQTLRRLPRSRVIVFTIRTVQHKLADVVRDELRRNQLEVALRTLPPDTAAYKGLTALIPLLLQALDRKNQAASQD